MKEKRGQFYIIAAIIIVIVVVALVSVVNYISVKKEPQKFYDISEILKREGTSVVTQAIYTDDNVTAAIGNFSDLFVEYVSQNQNEIFDLIIIYGYEGNYYARRYSRQSSGSVSVNLGGNEAITISESENLIPSEQLLEITESNVTLYVSGQPYSIEVNPETPNFFYVITTSEGFENYVISSQSGGQT